MTDAFRKLAPVPEPWTPTRATERIRAMAQSPTFSVTLTKHAQDQMAIRDLTMSDVNYVLRHGFVKKEAEPASRLPLQKYQVEYTSPNSNGRDVRVVVIPSLTPDLLKIVTVMWVDDARTSGS